MLRIAINRQTGDLCEYTEIWSEKKVTYANIQRYGVRTVLKLKASGIQRRAGYGTEQE